MTLLDIEEEARREAMTFRNHCLEKRQKANTRG
jgi:hypothetical protein